MSEEKKTQDASGCSHDCSNCSSNCSSRDPKSLIEKPNELSSIKKVIGIVSGKGGVGKSLVTSMMAVLTARKGYKTAILDADVTGPSIPKTFGVTERATADGKNIYPVVTNTGIQMMSLNLLVDSETTPVVWRGPVIAGAVKQFWTDVIWGEIDFLVVDLPPGTGDVMLTVMQQMPIDGAVVVSLPQKMVSVIVDKAIKMLHTLQVNVYGVVENMAYTVCPRCGEKTQLFDGEEAIAMVENEGVDIIAEYPLCSDLMNVSESQALSEEIAAQTVRMADAVCVGIENAD